MNAQVQIFNNDRFGQVRTSVSENGEPLFCLADICQAIGISNSRKVRSRLDDEDVTLSDTPTTSGIQSMSYVTESGMYDVIIRSDSPQAKPFRKWVTSEVLPSIRKQGGYMVAKAEETPEETMARALVIANDALKRRDEQLKEVEGAYKELYDNDELSARAFGIQQISAEYEAFKAKLVELTFWCIRENVDNQDLKAI